MKNNFDIYGLIVCGLFLGAIILVPALSMIFSPGADACGKADTGLSLMMEGVTDVQNRGYSYQVYIEDERYDDGVFYLTLIWRTDGVPIVTDRESIRVEISEAYSGDNRIQADIQGECEVSYFTPRGAVFYTQPISVAKSGYSIIRSRYEFSMLEDGIINVFAKSGRMDLQIGAGTCPLNKALMTVYIGDSGSVTFSHLLDAGNMA